MSVLNATVVGSAGRGQKTHGGSLAAFLASLSVAGGFSAVSLVIFVFLRGHFRNIYSRKITFDNQITLWHWLCRYATSGSAADNFERDTLQHAGGDGATFLRFLAIIVQILGLSCVTIVPILLTLNVQAGVERGIAVGMDQLSWGNISEANANRYWAHCLCAIFFVGGILLAIDSELNHAVRIRQILLSRPSLSHIVLLSDVPKPMLDKAKIRLFYSEAIQEPRTVEVALDVRALTKQIKLRDNALKEVERIETALFRERNKPSKESCRVGSRRSAQRLSTMRTALEAYNDRIKDLQSKCPLHCAVLMTFSSSSTAMTLERCLAFPTADCMAARYLGTESTYLKWNDIGIKASEARLRNTLSDALTICLTIVWAVPIALTGLLSQVTYLAQVLGAVWIIHLPESVLGILEGVLPQLALTVLMLIFPFLLTFTISLQRLPSRTMDEEILQSRYFVFVFLQQFLTVSVSSSAIAIIAGFLNRAETIPTVFATNIPKASNYFLSYIPLQALYCSAILCLQPTAFLNILIGRITDKTARDHYIRSRNVPSVQWGLAFPIYTNLACIAIIYAPIAPIIVPLAFISFGIFWLCFRYSITSITETYVESNGLLYPRALLQLFAGLYVGEVCWLGLFLLQINGLSSVLRAVCIGVLILLTAMMHRLFISKYSTLMQGCALNKATRWKNMIFEKDNVKSDPPPPNHKEDAYLLQRGPIDQLLPPEISAECPQVWVPIGQKSTRFIAHYETWVSSSDTGIVLKPPGRFMLDDAAQPPMIPYDALGQRSAQSIAMRSAQRHGSLS